MAVDAVARLHTVRNCRLLIAFYIAIGVRIDKKISHTAIKDSQGLCEINQYEAGDS